MFYNKWYKIIQEAVAKKRAAEAKSKAEKDAKRKLKSLKGPNNKPQRVPIGSSASRLRRP